MFSRSSVAVDNSFFGNNEAEDDGGVIVAQKGSKITVDNSLCDENTAGRNGGVMYAHSSSSITVNNSFFGNNRAGNYGGVMYARESSNITVDDSSFDNNDAGSGGGVMFTNISSSITVDNSSFDNNEAGNDGGAMSAHSNSSITVDNSSFENNEAGSGGGAMSALVGSSITADNSSFYSNEAGLYGGAVCVYFNSSITVDKSSFDNNYSRNYGGGMYAHSNSSITVDNSSFDNNEARGNGGVMAAGASSNITVDNSSFDNNIANRDGGVIFAQAGGNVTVDNSSFDNNEARNDGGVMVAYNSSITVDNSSFDNNEAGNGGVMHVHEKSNITVENSSFDSNKAGIFGGVVATYSGCKVTVDNSSFDNNGAGSDGGVMVAYNSSITVDNSSFDNNEAGTFGGVMATYSSSNVTVDNSSFDNNEADDDGGVMFAHSSSIIVGNSFFNNSEAGNDGGVIIAFLRGSITVDSSSFVNNEAGGNGGVMIASDSSSITVDNSYFDNNEAGDSGGVIAMFTSNFLTVTESTFIFNNANRGGAIYLQTGNSLTINNSNFIHNSANTDGGVIYSGNQNRLILSNNKLNFNRADNNGGVVCSLIQTKLAIIGDKSIFIGNQGHSGGVVFARKSKVSVHSQTLLMANNTAEDTGGAIHLSKANLTFFTGGNRLIRNQAGHGGAIYARKSRLVIETNSLTEISANLAMNSGGGMYLVMSKLNIRGNSSYITGNKVNKIGGGLHAANSRIIIEGTLHFTNNEAENGGGVSLERYSKLHGVSATNDIINFTSNRASHRGGALYVDDETNPDMCTAVATQNATSTTECFSALVSINFSDNSAGLAGPNLFGGLLDRCTLHTDFSNETEVVRTGATSFQRFSSISKPHLDTISSYPVRLCFCRDSQPDCDNLPENIQIDRRKTFSIELIAYDQVSNAVNATVDCSLNSSAGGLGESQVVQHISETCTEFHFNIFSPRKYEDLILSMRGSCDVPEFSERSVRIEITCTCPIGFQLANNDEVSCDCVCDRVLQPYDKTECNSTTQSIIRKENFWISYANSSGLIVYPNCPFDYCHPPRAQVSVNLNLPSGSDAQCASNRSGTLCGTCKPGLSVSLGSSRCLHCPTYWPGLLVMIVILFILSGVGLVALLLVLNLTVAVGTLNAIIFYANIVAANRIALFSTSDVSFASVFISWINFDLGIDICFYSGMNTYIKTWLQLAFPIYMFFLVGVIVGLCRYFDAFGHLIGRKDPVATLATLILLSNAKFITLLQTIITTLVPATLSDYYPDGSNKYVWLPDGTVDYLSSKHIILFFTAIIILLVGLAYTLLLFTWQWILCCPRKRIKYTCIRNQKFSSFLEIYHVPYTSKHRYWTGLLLLIRLSVYLVFAFGDSRITLLSTSFITSCLVIYTAVFRVRIYKQWFINAMEMFTYFNIIALSVFTLYIFDTDKNQAAVTNISVGITFAQLLVVISYHTYKYANHKVFSRIQESVICKKINEKLRLREQKRLSYQPPPADSDIHQFHQLLDMIDRPVNTNDYNITQVCSKPVEPTYSVVEVPKPHLTPPPPPLEEIREEPEPESQQQLTENQSASISKNKQQLNNSFGIEIAEYDDTTIIPGTRMEYSTTFEMKPISIVNPQIDIENESTMDVQQDDEETPEMFQASGEPEEAASSTANTFDEMETDND